MGWRYRRSIKILPGLRMNVGSRGVSSFSFGGRGVTINMNKHGVRSTFSLPGTGISYQTKTTSYHAPKLPSRPSAPTTHWSPGQRRSFGIYAVVGVAALIIYFALRPVVTASQTAMDAQRNSASSSVQASGEQLSLPPVITPAVSAEVPVPQVPSSSKQDPGKREAVTTTGANVRSLPSMSGSIITTLGAGVSVQVVETDGVWCRVLDHEGTPLGWVHGSILR